MTTAKSKTNAGGDSVFSATIPPHADNTVIEFYVSASDNANQQRTWPAPVRPSGQHQANALYQVMNQHAVSTAWTPGSPVIYHQIMTAAERNEFTRIRRQSNAQMNATFIAVSGTGVDVRYNAGVRIRGSNSRNNDVPNNRINLPADTPWQGITRLNVNAITPHDQIGGSALFRLAGLPSPEAKSVFMYNNGVNAFGGRLYAHVEPLGRDFVDNQFPNDGGGNLYKGRRDNESPPGGRSAGLRYYGPQPPAGESNPYVSYTKLTNESEQDWSDVVNLTYQLNDCSANDQFRQCDDNQYPDDYIERVGEVADIEQWLRYLAMNALLDNNEGGLPIGDPRGDDYAMYRGVDDPRFKMVTHDLDTLFGDVRRPIFRMEGNPVLRRFIRHPEIRQRYYAQLVDLIENVLLTDQANATLDESLANIRTPAQIESLKGFIRQRSQFVLSIIPREISIRSSLPVVGRFPMSRDAGIELSGTVPADQTRSVRVDGRMVTNYTGMGNWRFAADDVLQPGVNRILVEAFSDAAGQGDIVESTFIDIWHDPGSENPGQPQDETPAVGQVASLRVHAPNGYLPGIPFLVRVDALDESGQKQRELWNAEATLSVDNASVQLSTDRIQLVNGVGSQLVTVTGSNNFTLTARLSGQQATQSLSSLGQHACYASLRNAAGRIEPMERSGCALRMMSRCQRIIP